MSKSIVVSAGHCTIAGKSYDPGAVSKDNKLIEAKLMLRMRDLVAAKLRARGASVLEDGADGINEPLIKACALARTCPGRAVEFHLNASVNPQANGIEVLALPVHRAKAQRLAKAIQSVTGGKLRADNGFLDQSKGQHARLGFCVAGGMIVEFAFISNPSEMKIYLEKENLIADAVAEVLINLP